MLHFVSSATPNRKRHRLASLRGRCPYNPAEGRKPLFASGQPSKSKTLVAPAIKSLYPSSSGGKESACNAGDPGSIPRLGISPGEGNGNPLQYACLENSMDRGNWQATVHGIAESDMTEQLTLTLWIAFSCNGLFDYYSSFQLPSFPLKASSPSLFSGLPMVHHSLNILNSNSSDYS